MLKGTFENYLTGIISNPIIFNYLFSEVERLITSFFIKETFNKTVNPGNVHLS